MSTVTLDASNDWDVTGGLLSLTSGTAETVQRIAARLLLFKAEWFLDQRIGTPYFQAVLIKNPDLDAIRQMIRGIIAATQGVKSVLSVTMSLDRVHRRLTYTWSAKHDSGAVIVGGEGQPLIVTPRGVTQ